MSACWFASIILALALLTGCASSRHAQAPAPSWSAAYDADWHRATTCWQFTPPMRPDTVERTDCALNSDGIWRFLTPYSETGAASGIFLPSLYRVEFCDPRSLIHELSHAVRFMKLGDPGTNFSKECWL